MKDYPYASECLIDTGLILDSVLIFVVIYFPKLLCLYVSACARVFGIEINHTECLNQFPLLWTELSVGNVPWIWKALVVGVMLTYICVLILRNVKMTRKE